MSILVTEADLRQPARRFLPWLLVLFAGSGCSALIYEIVWFQLLQLSIGSSAVSLAVLLASFMGGMCLGSLALPRIVSARLHPLRVYALVELGTGILGISVLYTMPYVDRLYTASAGHGLPAILLRAAVSALVLLPPALLAGASLPAIGRWVETTPRGVSWLGFLYGSNIAGAVSGGLLAGFYLLRVHDTATATYAAAAINTTVALTALALAALTPHRAPAGEAAHDRVTAPGSAGVYVAIALSGACALGAEVIWTRLLSLVLGATVYTFSIILAVFLTGLGIGSGVGSFLARRIGQARAALGCCQLLLAAAIAWTAYVLARSLPYWPVDTSRSTWLYFGALLWRSAWAILPPTCLWGASFPLALRAAASRAVDPGRLAGGIYAANTLGAIAGALAFSLLLIPWLGTLASQRLLMGLSAGAALAALRPLLSSRRTTAAILLPASVGLAAWLAWKVPAVPWGVVAYGRELPTTADPGTLLYMGEGMNASVAISRLETVRFFHVSGKVEASSEPQDMRMQRMLGHVPALLHAKPRSALVVGFGAGVTAGALVPHPEVERIVICEIEPLIPPAAARFFGPENHDVLRDRRAEVVYDDARHYILTTRDRFDVITSDPIHPWVKGTATLYSKEYFELCRRHLNPGGVVAQWVPLYESNLDTVKSELATFFAVFPDGTIWGNDFDGEGYDVIVVGRAGAAGVDVDALEARLDRSDHAAVVKSLREVGLGSAVELLATYAGQAPDLEQWLRGAAINQDRNLRLQYLAGMGLNSKRSSVIYSDLLRQRRFPEELFVGSPGRKQALRAALEAQ